jgi:hypothetical protein
VRFGVAPDHPKIKSVTRVYEKTARHPGFRFFGGVRLGEHVTRAELLERYHAVVYAYGTVTDNRLGIPGEGRPGSHSATDNRPPTARPGTDDATTRCCSPPFKPACASPSCSRSPTPTCASAPAPICARSAKDERNASRH